MAKKKTSKKKANGRPWFMKAIASTIQLIQDAAKDHKSTGKLVKYAVMGLILWGLEIYKSGILGSMFPELMALPEIQYLLPLAIALENWASWNLPYYKYKKKDPE